MSPFVRIIQYAKLCEDERSSLIGVLNLLIPEINKLRGHVRWPSESENTEKEGDNSDKEETEVKDETEDKEEDTNPKKVVKKKAPRMNKDMFWTSFAEDFTNEERNMILKFVTGKSRMNKGNF